MWASRMRSSAAGRRLPRPRRIRSGEANKDLTELTLAVASLAVRVLLSANGSSVAKTMSVIDQWIETYGREADGLAGP
jgi:hypothetical protein